MAVVENRQWEAVLAARCLSVPYLGNGHESTYERVCELRRIVRRDIFHSVYAAFTQASGVGKTRAVLEMSKLGVYICYCSWASSNSTAFPPRSPILADMVSRSCSETDAVLYLKAWLLVLKKHLDAGVAADAWMEMQLRDDTIYSEVASCLCLEKGASAEAETLEKAASVKTLEAASVKRDLGDRDYKNRKLLVTELEDVTSRLQQEMETDDNSGYDSGHSSDGVTKPRVIFVFDEARGLLSSPDIATSPFYNIRRALRVFFRYPCFFALMLDTDATMSNFLPLDDHSARARPYGESLLPPIYYLPTMNLHMPQPGLKFEDYVKPSTWVVYGRPMWAARMQVDLSAQKCRSIVELAGLKLLRTLKGSFQGKQVNVLEGEMTESQAMAMLTAAAGLEVCPRSMLAQTMTASHMSLLLRVTENRSVMFVTLPPEPVLSEAAAGFLSHSEKVQVAALRHMVHACRQGYTSPGPRGEFVAKYILVAAVWSLKKDYCLQPIRIETYLRKLMDRSVWLELKARNLPADGYVFFNSFVGVSTVPDVAMLARCWAMGQAIMYTAENSLPGADIIIPVWTPLGMTSVVVSVKNLQRSGWLEKVSVEKVKCEFTRIEVASGLRVVTIVMSLREPAVKESTNWLLWEEAGAGDWERYIHLTSYGIHGNFDFIPNSVKQLLGEVLISVPNPFHDSTEQETKWIKGMLPDISTQP